MSSNMKLTVDKKMLPMKAHFFLFNAGTAPVVPFMPTLAKQLGFSSTVLGTIYTVLPIVGMLAKPLFGFIADRFHRQKLLFLIFQIITAIAFFCIMFVPAIPQVSTVQLHCNNGGSDLRFCPKDSGMDDCFQKKMLDRYGNQTISCDLSCSADPWMWDVICGHWNIPPGSCKKENPKFDVSVEMQMKHAIQIKECHYFLLDQVFMNDKNLTLYCPSNASLALFNSTCDIKCDEFLDDAMKETEVANKDVAGLYQFWLFFIFLAISWGGMAVIVSVGDAICFDMLGDRHHLYGKQRLWGAVGWGLFSVIAGFLVDEMSGGAVVKDYTIVFYLAVILIGLDMFASGKLQYTQTKLSTNILKDVGTTFLSLRVIIFLIWLVLVGLCTALMWNFLFWYLEDLAAIDKCTDVNYMKTLQGLVMGIQCFGGELPFFFLSGWILKKIGHINAMSLVLLGFGVRFLLYSILENPWWILPIELLNGVTFGIFYATMTSYASIVAPPGTEATLQGLTGAVFEGVGVSIGSFLAGLSFKYYGGSKTFQYFGICALCAFLIHAILQWILQKIGYNNGSSVSYLPPNDAIQILDDQESPTS